MSEQVVSDNPNVVSLTLSGNAQTVVKEILRNKARYLAADNQNYWLTGYTEVREGVYTFQGSVIDDRLETTNLGDVLVVRLMKPDDARIRFVALAYPVMDQTGWFYRVLRIIAEVWTETKADIENHIFYWSHWSSDRQELRRQGWKTVRVFDLISDELLSDYIWWETADDQVDEGKEAIAIQIADFTEDNVLILSRAMKRHTNRVLRLIRIKGYISQGMTQRTIAEKESVSLETIGEDYRILRIHKIIP